MLWSQLQLPRLRCRQRWVLPRTWQSVPASRCEIFFSGQDESVSTLVTDLSTGTDRTLVTEMRRLSIITGAGRVLVMGAYTGRDGSVERRTSSYAKTHMRHPRADSSRRLPRFHQPITNDRKRKREGRRMRASRIQRPFPALHCPLFGIASAHLPYGFSTLSRAEKRKSLVS
jgi:hypothetical protein